MGKSNFISDRQGLEYLEGSVERVTFHSEETGFCVLRAKVKSHRDLITVVGESPNISPGEYIQCRGSWLNDPRYGLQFRSSNLKTTPPSTTVGIEKYLGSGMIKGIGPHFAKKLVKAFGDEVFDVIEKNPERLTELEGIGEKRRARVVEAWKEQKAIRKIMVFLHENGVGSSRAVRIYKTYGDEAIEKVKQNPYQLAFDIHGIGFKTADQIAEKLGIPKDSLIRARAGVCHVLQSLCEFGHCAAFRTKLAEASHELLEIPLDIIDEAIDSELDEERLVQDSINSENAVYPRSLYLAESGVATNLSLLSRGYTPLADINVSRAIPWVEKITGLQLSSSQRVAIRDMMSAKVSIITGGPGVGKTTIVRAILAIIKAKHLRVKLCAPTGRASKRLSESTGEKAKTIHRLLEFDPSNFGFKHNRDNPLSLDVLIVDEASMIDIVLLNHLLKAIPPDASVVFVGDIDQLPSVGPGKVLLDMIRSGTITVVRLTEIFRQAKDSKIITNAHRVNRGKMPEHNAANNSDFFTIYEDEPEDIQQKLISLVSKRLPKHYKLDPITDIQVLAPMNRGSLGCFSLNVELQKILNGSAEPKISKFGSTYAKGDKVIQNKNNYEKDVFNGDIGFVTEISDDGDTISIEFDGEVKEYETHELDEVNLAYAISIHKSQGSEFPVVVIPLATQHYTLLARNLLYTGITRGKKLVVLIGQKKAIGMAISNNKELNRLTKLQDRLMESCPV